MTEDI